jgi:hypothetical protein
MRITSLAFAMTLAVLPVAGLAHGDAPRKAAAAQPMVETAFGRTGDPRKAARTIRVDMSDRMRFSPDTIEVKRATPSGSSSGTRAGRCTRWCSAR